MRVVLLGYPGAGKGTLANHLKRKFPFLHLSTGDIFRGLGKETPLGKKVSEIISTGALVPDEVTIEVVKNRLEELADSHYLLDGFPRTIVQADALSTFAPADKVLFLDAPQSILIDRLTQRISCPKCAEIYNKKKNPPKKAGICDLCGTPLKQRSDDTEETVTTRLAAYEKETAPLVEYYEKLGNFYRLDASTNGDDVFSQACKIFEKDF